MSNNALAATKIPWVLIGLALALRLAWGMSRPASDEMLAALPDQVEYLTLGRNLINGQGLWFVDPRFNDKVYAFRMPGYPLMVAACGGNVRIIRAVQAALDTGTVLAAFVLASLLIRGNRWHPCLAAGLVAVNPLLIYFSGLILSETLFVAMLTWAMVLLLAGFPSAHSPARARIWLPGGILLATSVLVRPSAALLPIVLGFGAWQAARIRDGAQPNRNNSNWPLPILVMTLLVGLTLTPWALRNYRLFHHLIWTDTNAGMTLYDGYNPLATGASDQSFVRSLPELQSMDELARSNYLTNRAIKFIQNNRTKSAVLAMAKLTRTWSPMPLSEQFARPQYVMIGLLYSVPFDLLILFGLWSGGVRRPVKVFLVSPALYLTMVHALTIGSLRYRLPAEPALAVLAACALVKHEPKQQEK